MGCSTTPCRSAASEAPLTLSHLLPPPPPPPRADIKLVAVKIDGQALAPDAYTLEPNSLTIKAPPAGAPGHVPVPATLRCAAVGGMLRSSLPSSLASVFPPLVHVR